MSRGMGGHQSARAGKDEWLTPPRILDLLGPFDLDPCAPIQRPWPMAVHHYTIVEEFAPVVEAPRQGVLFA